MTLGFLQGRHSVFPLEKGFRRCCSVKMVFLARLLQRKNAKGESAIFFGSAADLGLYRIRRGGVHGFFGKAKDAERGVYEFGNVSEYGG